MMAPVATFSKQLLKLGSLPVYYINKWRMKRSRMRGAVKLTFGNQRRNRASALWSSAAGAGEGRWLLCKRGRKKMVERCLALTWVRTAWRP